MTFQIAKQVQANLEATLKAASQVLKAIPGHGTGIAGLTPDHIRLTPEYQAAAKDVDVAFSNLRAFNGKFVKTFAKDLRAERRARFAA